MSRVVHVPLPGPIALVPAPKMLDRFMQDRQRYPDLPDPTRLSYHLAESSTAGGVPARVEPGRGDPALAVYGKRFVAVLYPTKKQDSYFIGRLSPLRFQDHDRLARAALLLQPAGWYMFPELAALPRERSPYQTHWPLINRAWQWLSQQNAHAVPTSPGGPPAHHVAALDLWEQVIEATRIIEITKQRNEPPLPYRAFHAAGEERHSKRSVYVFELARPARIGVGARVQLEGGAEPDGQLTRVDGRHVTVRFTKAVHLKDIDQQGHIHVLPSDRVYRAQADAVQRIRQGEAACPHLMPVLVDRAFLNFQPDATTAPAERLDPEQQDAFGKALKVPDMSLVLGPPGTGKTRTIAQVARACAAQGQRVLVTSHTNRAVDNVLERLPEDVRSVRVGSESTMTTFAKGKMVEAQVESLRDQILADTAGTASRLAAFASGNDWLDRWLTLLGTELDAATVALHDAGRAAQARDEVARRVAAPAVAELTRRTAAVNDLAEAMARCERKAAARRERTESAAIRAGTARLGWWWRWLAERRLARHRRAEGAVADLRTRHKQATDDLAAASAHLENVLSQVPEAERWRGQRERRLNEYATSRAELTRAGTVLRQATAGLVPHSPALPDDPDGWRIFQSWAQQAAGRLRSQADLVAEWRQQIRQPGEDLQHELVRYADVVAATCIGSAVTSLLKELTFDVAIVDEAGQIALPNLLVPLVRARRSVLVGDHHQLPPYLDDELTGPGGLLSTAEDPVARRQVAEILTRSTFEWLFDTTPASHRTALEIQRRMPIEVANFISASFYGRRLRTLGPPAQTADPVFRRPFVLVDTGDREPGVRTERRRQGTEDWAQPGYVNPLEADLISRILVRLAPAYKDWGVIVPYRAQRNEIIRLLGSEMDEDTVIDNVGTVDSFQGGERDLIVYGFTRSNRAGEVGFLRELRRLNVALSRVKRQLVVVGDMNTLTHARDANFAALAMALHDHVGQIGVVEASSHVAVLLDGHRERR